MNISPVNYSPNIKENHCVNFQSKKKVAQQLIQTSEKTAKRTLPILTATILAMFGINKAAEKNSFEEYLELKRMNAQKQLEEKQERIWSPKLAEQFGIDKNAEVVDKKYNSKKFEDYGYMGDVCGAPFVYEKYVYTLSDNTVITCKYHEICENNVQIEHIIERPDGTVEHFGEEPTDWPKDL